MKKFDITMMPTGNSEGIDKALDEGFEPFAVAQEMIMPEMPKGGLLSTAAPAKPMIITVMYFKRLKESV